MQCEKLEDFIGRMDGKKTAKRKAASELFGVNPVTLWRIAGKKSAVVITPESGNPELFVKHGNS